MPHGLTHERLDRIERDDVKRKRLAAVRKEKASSAVSTASKRDRLATTKRKATTTPRKKTTSVSTASNDKYNRESYQGLPKRSIRRLAWRSGIKRLSDSSYHVIGSDIVDKTRRLAEISALLAEYDGRSTVSVGDVEMALHELGMKLYF